MKLIFLTRAITGTYYFSEKVCPRASDREEFASPDSFLYYVQKRKDLLRRKNLMLRMDVDDAEASEKITASLEKYGFRGTINSPVV